MLMEKIYFSIIISLKWIIIWKFFLFLQFSTFIRLRPYTLHWSLRLLNPLDDKYLFVDEMIDLFVKCSTLHSPLWQKIGLKHYYDYYYYYLWNMKNIPVFNLVQVDTFATNNINGILAQMVFSIGFVNFVCEHFG